MGIAKEHLAQVNRMLDQVRKMVNLAETSAENGVAVHVFEGDVWSEVLKMGYQLMNLFFACCGNGDVGAQLTASDGRSLKRLPEMHIRQYLSIFGLFELERYVYGTREGQRIEQVPFDIRLQFPESKFSYLLQDWVQSLVVHGAYSEAIKTIFRMLKLKPIG